jgi:serine/threonine protein phosphatase 1
MIPHFERNTAGRDFAVGDIHGMFGMLETQLGELGFDMACDRLFSVGDLVDRGPRCEAALDWLAEPWFFAVRGNHEQMAIDYAADQLSRGRYTANGGAWFIALPAARQQRYVAAFETLPFAIEIDSPQGLIGIVHADCPFSRWDDLRQGLTEPHHREPTEQACLWSRSRHNCQLETPVTGVQAIIVGHTPAARVRRLGNVFYIDTGAVFEGGSLTLIDLAVPLM